MSFDLSDSMTYNVLTNKFLLALIYIINGSLKIGDSFSLLF
jgi:hypothetical protein